MDEPLISVIVPVYMVEKYLERCVDSIIRQTYGNLEIILVDDGSLDGCPKICDRYAELDGRVMALHKENGGLSDARNAGIGAAAGDYVTFIDADDFVLDDYVEYLYMLINNSGADISVCGMRSFDDMGALPPKRRETGSAQTLTTEQALRTMMYQEKFDTSACGKLYRPWLFEGIPFPSGRLYEDMGTIYKIIDRSRGVVFGPLEKYFYYRRDDSIMTGAFTLRKMDLIDISEEMLAFVSERYPQIKAAAVRRYVYCHFHILHQLVFCRPRHRPEEKRIASGIKAHAITLLADRNAPAKEKVAVICLLFGAWFFKLCFRAYRFFKKSREPRSGKGSRPPLPKRASGAI